MVKLALYRGHGQIGNALIRWWTGSQYSHCELVVDDVWMSSTVRDGGVRSKTIDPHPGSWDFIELPWADPYKIVGFFEFTKGEEYGWLDLLRSQLFNQAYDYPRSAFCSEWCAAALGLPNPTSYSPKTLGELCLFLTNKVFTRKQI